jgi:hypothetical protein
MTFQFIDTFVLYSVQITNALYFNMYSLMPLYLICDLISERTENIMWNSVQSSFYISSSSDAIVVDTRLES